MPPPPPYLPHRPEARDEVLAAELQRLAGSITGRQVVSGRGTLPAAGRGGGGRAANVRGGRGAPRAEPPGMRVGDARDAWREYQDGNASAASLAVKHNLDVKLLQQALNAATLPHVEEVTKGNPPTTFLVAVAHKRPDSVT